jgi:hypothetical protein
MAKPRLLPGLLFAAMLIAAQGALALHAHEADDAATPGKVCAACVAAGQLAGSSLDDPATDAPGPAAQPLVPTADGDFDSLRAPTARQRGPPATI